MRSIIVLTLGSFLPLSVARLAHSLPDDPFASPKFKTVFYNDLPLLNDTAQRWLREGLIGGEDEFLEQAWQPSSLQTPALDPSQTEQSRSSKASLEHMRMGPNKSYLCLVPPFVQSSPAVDEPEVEPSTAQSWSLLQPLTDKCLYLRNHWFTYSYCHNREVRQFHELPISSSSGHRPEEDKNEDAFTLGKAPSTDTDLAIRQGTPPPNVELVRSAGSMYLVQRWGDGTLCDKTGEPRDIEIQFHCSMTQTDTILFVREAKTCSYVLVIHTPRLCGEPGFKSPRDSREETLIRCRQVVTEALPSTPPPAGGKYQHSEYPAYSTKVQHKLQAEAFQRFVTDTSKANSQNLYTIKLKQALEKLLGGKAVTSDETGKLVIQGGSSGNDQDDARDIVIEFVDADSLDADVGELVQKHKTDELRDTIVDKLRAAGYKIPDQDEQDEKAKGKKAKSSERDTDEL